MGGSGVKELERINNVLEFLSLYAFEFSCLFEDLIQHQKTLRGTIYARQLILLIYESAEKLRHLLGRQFQEDMQAIGYSVESVELVRRVLRCFNDVFERCNREFGDVRNGAIAHRDRSASTQRQLVEKVHPDLVAEIAAEMSECVLKLQKIFVQHNRNVLEWLQCYEEDS